MGSNLSDNEVEIIVVIPFAKCATFYLNIFRNKNYHFVFLVQDDKVKNRITIDELKKGAAKYKFVLFCGIPVRFWKNPISRWKRAWKEDWILEPLLWEHWGDLRKYFSKGFLPREQKELIVKSRRIVKVSEIARFIWKLYPYYYIKYQLPKQDYRSWVFFTSSQIFQSIDFKNLEEDLRKHDFRLTFDTIISRPTGGEYRTRYKPWDEVWGLQCKKYDSRKIF